MKRGLFLISLLFLLVVPLATATSWPVLSNGKSLELVTAENTGNRTLHTTEGEYIGLNEYILTPNRTLQLKSAGLGFSVNDVTKFRDVITTEEFEFVTGTNNYSTKLIDNNLYYVKVNNPFGGPSGEDRRVVLTWGSGASYNNTGSEATNTEPLDASMRRIHLFEGENISIGEYTFIGWPGETIRLLQLKHAGLGFAVNDITTFRDVLTTEEIEFVTGTNNYSTKLINNIPYYVKVNNPSGGPSGEDVRVVLTWGWSDNSYGNRGSDTIMFVVREFSECISNCSGKQCGSDGCEGNCGNCTSGKICNSNGVCVNPCEDSDGGINYYTKGITMGSYEQCYNNKTLGELYCLNSTMMGRINFTCPYACSNGACFDETTPITQCNDSDGGKNYAIKGNTSAVDMGTSYDSCYGKTLTEMYCFGNGVNSEQYTCLYDCSNGACINETPVLINNTFLGYSCLDSDGGINYFVSGGIFTASRYSQAGIASVNHQLDYCSGNVLIERYCNSINNGSKTINYTCPYACFNGSCIDETPTMGNMTPETTPSTNCTDTDGGKNYLVKGSASAEGMGTTYDVCDGNYIVEAYCLADGIKTEKHLCELGCGDGICFAAEIAILGPEAKPQQINASKTESISFTTKTGKIFSGTINDVKEDKATITIENNTFTLNIGGEEKLDLDNDGVYDLSVTLNNLAQGKAGLTLEEISEAAEPGVEIIKKSNIKWFIMGGLLLAIIIIAGVIAIHIMTKKNEEPISSAPQQAQL